jgi:hypothetical protein
MCGMGYRTDGEVRPYLWMSGSGMIESLLKMALGDEGFRWRGGVV